MSDIMQDLSPSSMAPAIDANLFAMVATFGRRAQVEIHDGPDLLWVDPSDPFPPMKGVFRAQFALDEVHARIDSTVSRFKSPNKGVGWWVGPTSRPKDLGKYLVAHGFSHARDTPGMAADLHALNETLPSPPNLSIEQVCDERTLRQWTETAAKGFGFSQTAAQDCFEQYVRLGLGDREPWRLYLGRLDGEPVAISVLFLGAGVAGLYWVATIPEARRQGVGSALTLRPLVDARGMGYRIGVLSATTMGEPVYRRLGFQEYCKVSLYLLPASSEGTLR